ncbi:MAG TPA: UbiA family prenyltransferase [Nitrososphaerales archaeon]|nr:UbiA family prenyltransferase [Nitrososphaerales archaeon]HUK75230.1 UbiA family prenyltransferase [Nitrososphaerales archaeon]
MGAKGTLASVVGLRAWKLALAGPSVYWYLPIFYVLLSTQPHVDPVGLAALFMVMMLSASWGFLLNDLADREADAKSGRADLLHGHGLSRAAMWTLIILCAAVSWLVVFLIGGGYVFKAVLAVDYLIATLYSVRPAKLKVRKFWGFLANSLMERPLPILVFLTYMDYYTPATILFPVLMELSWSVFKHQAADIKEDLAAHVMTFAASLGERLSYRIVKWFLNPLSVLSLLFLVGLSWLSIPGLRAPLALTFVVMAGAVALAFAGEATGKVKVYITPTDPPYIIALNLTYRYVLLVVMAYGTIAMRPGYYLMDVLFAITLCYQTVAYYGILRKRKR